jgi:hypothetical protein
METRKLKPLNSFDSGSKIMRNEATEIVYSNLEETHSVYLSHVFFFASCEAIELCEPKIGAVIMKVLWGNRLF